ncbi:DUF3124 domain-containing protein [Crocosphaera sp. Alani8]|uniref:DUF3124 domain-containing protein n=1 Tax=Crocosphaera sp. Alani8 TaxID=3038952 RepID=UPI00313CC7E2
MKNQVFEQRKIIFASCLLFGLLGSCANQTQRTSDKDISTEQQLSNSPGVTQLLEESLPTIVAGQVIYVPVYSEIFDFDSNRVSQLTTTLSLRNTDLVNPIVLETIDYYNSGGEKVRTYLTKAIQLAPLASTEVVVPKDDQTGGVGANFIVKWGATKKVSPPVVEAVMISTISQQGMSFVSPGRVIQERGTP